MVRSMRPGAVIVDVAIDQGGCVETSRETTHQDPTFVEHGVVHYCVGNMPGAVPATATQALPNATLPYLLEVAVPGATDACLREPVLAARPKPAAGEGCQRGVVQGHGESSEHTRTHHKASRGGTRATAG